MSAELSATLRSALAGSSANGLCVAFSGGPDSTALLHALAQLPGARQRGLRALHVDHGLHADSAVWAGRCAAFCASLDVPLATVRVQIDDTRGEGVEAAARRARREAFANNLGDGEWLALAHHRDDQVETILLKLLRGAGPEGLGGMRALSPFARGFLWRPFLETPRETLRKYLSDNELTCIDDPANRDPRFARNVLRRAILPHVRQHWPHADASILHAAKLCRTAADHVSAEADAALAALRRDDDTLDACAWRALPKALRAPALDAWLYARKLPCPPDATRTELTRQTTQAADDRVPRVAWPGAEVRVWAGRLHAMSPLAAPPENWQAPWRGEPLTLPAGCGTLLLEPKPSGANVAPCDPPLRVRLRRGGERIKPAGDSHTRELRNLFQQARLPPWWRTRCPLIFADDELVAVADLWASERGTAIFNACRAQPRWTRPP